MCDIVVIAFIPPVDSDEMTRFISALFPYALPGSFVSLRGFHEDRTKPGIPIRAEAVRVGESLDGLIAVAVAYAERCRRHREPTVFAPPICTFTSVAGARAEDLAEALTLSVDCDRAGAPEAVGRLATVLGAPTVVVASGGECTDPETGEATLKLHAHWRLSEAATTAEEHAKARRARDLMAKLAGGDPTVCSIVHPLRWPGTYNRKDPANSRPARIIELNNTEVHLDAAAEVLEMTAAKLGNDAARGNDAAHDAASAASTTPAAPPTGRARDYAWKQLLLHRDRVANAAEGTRHAALYSSARLLAGMAHCGAYTAESAFAILHEATVANGTAERGDEVPRTFRDSWTEGLKKPIDVDDVFGPEIRMGQPEGQAAEEEPWPELIDLTAAEADLPTFPSGLLPTVYRTFAEDTADRMQVPTEFVAIPLIIEAGTMLGRAFRIQPQREDPEWTERACLWGMTIAPSGVRKTPATEAALWPISKLQSELWARRQTALAQWQALPREERGKTPEPPGGHVMVNDATAEALMALMDPVHNSDMRGMLFYADELASWYLGMDKYHQGNDRKFFLRCHSGGPHGKYRADRSRNARVQDCFLSIYGTMQPSVLDGTFRGNEVDGLLARFQLAVYPRLPDKFTVVDRPPHTGARDAVSGALHNLHDMQMVSGTEGLQVLKLDEEAGALFKRWRNKHENRLDLLGQDTAWAAHLLKYAGTAARLSLALHFMRYGTRARVTIGAETVGPALQFIDEYLEPHAARIYGRLDFDPDRLGAVKIARWVKDTRPAVFTANDIRRHDWNVFTQRQASGKAVDGDAVKRSIAGALDLLTAYGWVRCVERKTTERGGRPTIVYVVNPAILRRGSASRESS